MSGLRRSLAYLALIPVNIILGTAWHEIVGHGLIGLACGGQLKQIIVTGLQIWPQVRWVGTGGIFGWCEVTGVNGPVCSNFWLLTGSVSTFVVSGLAIVFLFLRTWSWTARMLLIGLSFWWIDLFTYTLPSFGLRRYIVFGRKIAEPFDAAVGLGIPGPLFQLLVIVLSGILAYLSIRVLKVENATKRNT